MYPGRTLMKCTIISCVKQGLFKCTGNKKAANQHCTELRVQDRVTRGKTKVALHGTLEKSQQARSVTKDMLCRRVQLLLTSHKPIRCRVCIYLVHLWVLKGFADIPCGAGAGANAYPASLTHWGIALSCMASGLKPA